MAIIENTTPRVENKLQSRPSISIRETLELSTDRVSVNQWADHLHCEIHLETNKRKLKIRLGHNDVLNIYNQTKKILNL